MVDQVDVMKLVKMKSLECCWLVQKMQKMQNTLEIPVVFEPKSSSQCIDKEELILGFLNLVKSC
jgi:hypothetical protein